GFGADEGARRAGGKADLALGRELEEKIGGGEREADEAVALVAHPAGGLAGQRRFALRRAFSIARHAGSVSVRRSDCVSRLPTCDLSDPQRPARAARANPPRPPSSHHAPD